MSCSWIAQVGVGRCRRDRNFGGGRLFEFVVDLIDDVDSSRDV